MQKMQGNTLPDESPSAGTIVSGGDKVLSKMREQGRDGVRRNVRMEYAFGWPKNSVRALITLSLLVMTAAFGFFILFTTRGMDQETLKVVNGVFTAFVSLTSLMIGSYITKNGK